MELRLTLGTGIIVPTDIRWVFRVYVALYYHRRAQQANGFCSLLLENAVCRWSKLDALSVDHPLEVKIMQLLRAFLERSRWSDETTIFHLVVHITCFLLFPDTLHKSATHLSMSRGFGTVYQWQVSEFDSIEAESLIVLSFTIFIHAIPLTRCIQSIIRQALGENDFQCSAFTSRLKK